jgi:hypothetical protein
MKGGRKKSDEKNGICFSEKPACPGPCAQIKSYYEPVE